MQAPVERDRTRGRRGRERLDAALVTRGLVETRAQAARLVLAGAVAVDGRRVDKAGTPVGPDARLEVATPRGYVSRGGEKLAHTLDAFRVSPAGRVCLDVGASTGGFTDCLLARGAVRVYAVDVGWGQIDPALRADPRVVVMERTNARRLVPDRFVPRPQLAVVDVSFISLEKILPSVFGVLGEDAEVVALVKPQFEVGRGLVGKGGVVRDPAQHRTVLARVAESAGRGGWSARAAVASPLRGPKGNREFFLHLGRSDTPPPDLEALVRQAVGEGLP
jgi:23S rRNA (cytidine1920-2'-O)/16S rRNA (cytidine1409-2'-O)-methyltransferase